MDVSEAILWGQYTVMAVAVLSGPPLLAAMITGFVISLFQAVTQIQEMTLVFVPKIIAVVATLTILGGWLLTQLITFGQRCFMAASVVNQ